MRVSESDDYCVLELQQFEFYYGYEYRDTIDRHLGNPEGDSFDFNTYGLIVYRRDQARHKTLVYHRDDYGDRWGMETDSMARKLLTEIGVLVDSGLLQLHLEAEK